MAKFSQTATWLTDWSSSCNKKNEQDIWVARLCGWEVCCWGHWCSNFSALLFQSRQRALWQAKTEFRNNAYLPFFSLSYFLCFSLFLPSFLPSLSPPLSFSPFLHRFVPSFSCYFSLSWEVSSPILVMTTEMTLVTHVLEAAPKL